MLTQNAAVVRHGKALICADLVVEGIDARHIRIFLRAAVNCYFYYLFGGMWISPRSALRLERDGEDIFEFTTNAIS